MSPLEIFLTALSAVASICAIVFGYKAYRRNQRSDDRGEAQKLTAMETKLDFISGSVSRIESNQHDQSLSIAGLSERVTRVEESAKQAHKRIDALQKSAS